MIELNAGEFWRVRHLFQPLDYSLSILAAIEGNNPGRIFVDYLMQPRTALGLTVEGYFLVGDDQNPKTNASLHRLFKEKIFTGQVFINGDWSMSLAVHPQTWVKKLPELIPTHEIEAINRYHYVCKSLKYDWRYNMPNGYTVKQLDEDLLGGDQVNFSEDIRDWMDIEQVWGSEKNFLSKGVSFCVLHENEVVSWCTSDCVTSEHIEIGIFTLPAYRRQGLGTLAVAATVEYCLAYGIKAVGWHCNVENVGSWKTAERVGFERKHEYTYYYYIYDQIDHLAELGWYYFKQGNFEKTTSYYERVFSQREDNPNYYYHLAAAAYAAQGRHELAIKYLNGAVDHGWKHAEWTRGVEQFQDLAGTPDWEAVLARMEAE
jgi:GNAT superfamily N-acetyltransferase